MRNTRLWLPAGCVLLGIGVGLTLLFQRLAKPRSKPVDEAARSYERIRDAGGIPVVTEGSYPSAENIYRVEFSRREVTSKQLEPLKELPNIEELDINLSPFVTSEGFAALTPLPQLKEIVISRSSIGEKALAHLQGLSNLQSLRLYDVPINDDVLANLRAPATLRCLELPEAKVTDEGVKHLSGLVNLEELDLQGTGVGDQGLEHLSGLVKLKTLYLGRTKVGDRGVQHLVRMVDFGGFVSLRHGRHRQGPGPPERVDPITPAPVA